MRYNIDADLDHLQAAGCRILSWTETANGHVILWHDSKGWTNTVREPKGTSISGILSFEVAKAEYIQCIQRLLHLGGIR